MHRHPYKAQTDLLYKSYIIGLFKKNSNTNTNNEICKRLPFPGNLFFLIIFFFFFEAYFGKFLLLLDRQGHRSTALPSRSPCWPHWLLPLLQTAFGCYSKNSASDTCPEQLLAWIRCFSLLASKYKPELHQTSPTQAAPTLLLVAPSTGALPRCCPCEQ